MLGRDALIDELWDILQTQSIVMTAERRIGKTSIIRKMLNEPRNGWLPVLQDLEKFHTASEFAIGVFDEVAKHLGKTHAAIQKLKIWWSELGGTEIGGILKLPENGHNPWKELLRSTVENLVQSQEDKSLVFFWDEMPYMIESIRRTEDEATAIELLDVLRELRQTHDSFRMVVTGSIGLHHVITKLRATGYTNQPLNDLHIVEVNPLAEPDATDLARRLLEGEEIQTADLDDVAETIAAEVDGFPFYIHHLVHKLKGEQDLSTAETVKQCVAEHLTAANDPWQLRHFLERIPAYYPNENEQLLALAVLDSLSISTEPLSKQELWGQVKTRGTFSDQNRFRHVLTLLAQDHYVEIHPSGSCQFRFSIIRRWWQLERGL